MKIVLLLTGALLIADACFAQVKAKPHRHHKPGRVVAAPAPAIFKYVEQEAAFPGEVIAYINSKLRYPDDARENGIEGRAEVLFEIRANGSVRVISLRRSAGSASMDAEARRVLSNMPAWSPRKVQGIPCRSLMVLPVVFRLD